MKLALADPHFLTAIKKYDFEDFHEDAHLSLQFTEIR
ncbi:hypothetical protein PEC331060_01350 [Pectobacterium carotovorum subsp. carotovorum]|nr:hypothetical protein PEC331060_01350 [Pectobacterium carotovorum subsp. carotovorum]